jgi:hypothetical protein
MKTMTEEVDTPAKLNASGVKWYTVRPPLLSILIAEVLTAAGLIALEPDSVRFWVGRACSGMTIGVRGIEVVLLCLASLAGIWAALRARRGERFRVERLFRRTESDGLSKPALC